MFTPDKPDPARPSAATGPAAAVARAVPPQPTTTPAGARPGAVPWWLWIGGGVVVLAALIAGTLWLLSSFNRVSTDDAYVNGHVTFVAPRVAGQVAHVLVDDNNRVHKGDLLVQLDKEPYQVQVDIAQAAVTSAQADVVTAQAQVRGLQGQIRGLRFNLDRSIEDVDNQTAVLRSKVATWKSQTASLAKAQADYDRAKPLVGGGASRKRNLTSARRRWPWPRHEPRKRSRASIRCGWRWACHPNPRPATT